MSEDNGATGNNRGFKLWILIKNAAFLVTLLLFVLAVVILLDAYKFVSVRHAKFARNKLLTTLQYMDPSLIESHSGFHVMQHEEFDSMNQELSGARSKIREANSELQEKYSEVLKASVEVQAIKKDMEDLARLAEEAKAEPAKAEETKEEPVKEEVKVEPPKEEVKEEPAKVEETKGE
jgi:hypothetical protein